MHGPVRSAIGLDALAHMSPHHILTAKTWAVAHEQLKEEVMDGRSTVILNPRGLAGLVVSVTALHIEGKGQRFLAQIAKWDVQLGSAIRPIVALPVSAQQFREFPFDAARRILRTKFQADDTLVEAHDLEREVTYKESQGFKVHTKHVRAVFRVKFCEPLHLPGYRAQAITADAEECLPTQRSFSHVRPGVIGSGISDVLGEREVFVLKQPEKFIFYLWVSQSEFTRLQEPENGNTICTWLHTLNLDPPTSDDVVESELL